MLLPENSQLTAQKKSAPIIKGVVAFKLSGSNIMWIGTDGYLKQSDSNGQNIEQLSQAALKIDLKKPYKLETLSGNTFLKAGNSLLLFDKETKTFLVFHDAVKDFKISGDNQKVVYFNDSEILISLLSDNLKTINSLVKTQDKISDFYWLNNDYIIYTTTNNIIISEIDYRGNINSVTLPMTLNLADNTAVTVEKPQIFFDQPNKKLYILTQNQLLATDKLLP